MTERERQSIAKAGLNESDFSIPEITPQEKTEAQALYTAIMTDTLLEDDE